MSKAKITNKKVIQDSQEDSSSELPLIVNKKEQIKAKKQVKVTKKPAPVESSEQDETPVVKAKTTQKPRKQSNASMDQESQKVQKKTTKVVKTQTAPIKKKKKQESSEESEEEVKPVKKVVAKSPLQKPVVAKKPVKPESSSDEQSEEQVKPVKKAVVAKSPLSKPVVAKKKQQSSDQQSQEQVKPKAKVVAKKPVKKVESSEQQEQQKPKAPVRKVSNDLKVVKKQQPKQQMQEDDEQGEFQACVQGLSFNAYDNDIRELFESCGQILNLNVLMRPDGKPKGIAFVKFGRRSHLNKALEMTGQQHFGRSLKIEQARGKATARGDSMPGRGRGGFQGGSKPSFENNAVIETPTLFIGGLSYNSTAESIKEHFSSSGAVQSARVVTDRQTGKARGFGYIEFYDVQTAKSAYATLNGSYLDGRAIRLDSAAQRDRPAGGDRGGFGGNRGGFGGGSRGGFGGNSRNPGNSTVNLSEDDKNAKKGAIGTFQGKKMTF